MDRVNLALWPRFKVFLMLLLQPQMLYLQATLLSKVTDRSQVVSRPVAEQFMLSHLLLCASINFEEPILPHDHSNIVMIKVVQCSGVVCSFHLDF